MVKIVVGNSVEGPNFFGRDRDMEALGRLVEADHLLLLAPRRVGKTSLLRAMPHMPRSDGRIPVYADVQDCKSETRFVESVLNAVYATAAGRKARPSWWRRWRARSKSRVKKVEAAGLGIEVESVDHGWTSDADEAFDRLLALDHHWLVLIDEVPNVVVSLVAADPGGARVRAFLSWFRRLRLRVDAKDKLRFVLCGSIGLDHVARRHAFTDTINDLRTWHLGPFEHSVAEAFLSEIADAYEWMLSGEVRALILREVEWYIPHHLQGVMSELQNLPHGGVIEPGHIESAVEALITRRNYFNSWHERLTAVLGSPSDDHARAVLLACAHDPRGAIPSTLLGALAGTITDPDRRAAVMAELLDILTQDGYLVESEGRQRFRSSILRRYWLKHFA
jgi:hypothetical protein